jgi:hypothetical protein
VSFSTPSLLSSYFEPFLLRAGHHDGQMLATSAFANASRQQHHAACSVHTLVMREAGLCGDCPVLAK